MWPRPDAIFRSVEGDDGARLVLLNWDEKPPSFRNMMKYSATGDIVWVVEPLHPLEGVYTGITLNGGVIQAYNMAGFPSPGSQ